MFSPACFGWCSSLQRSERRHAATRGPRMALIFLFRGGIMETNSRMQVCTCPTCGGSIGEAAPINAVRDAVTAPMRRIIFDTLSRSPGQPVMREVIVSRIYGGRSDGGPDDADHVVKATVSQLRRQIEPFGWTITHGRGGSGNLAQWRLIPTVAGAV